MTYFFFQCYVFAWHIEHSWKEVYIDLVISIFFPLIYSIADPSTS